MRAAVLAIVSRGKEPSPGGDKRYARCASEHATRRECLLEKDERAKQGDPQHVHDASYEQQRHEHPATTHAIRTVVQSE
jgi:hypothetical protein